MSEENKGNTGYFGFPTWTYVIIIPILVIVLLPYLLLILGLLFNWESSSINFNPTSITYNALLFGALYLGLAISLTLGYKILKFPNFAVGEYFLVGGYIALYISNSRWFSSYSNDNPSSSLLFVALIAGFIGTGLISVLVDLLVFKPLRQRDATPQTLMISSLGVSLGLRALLTIRFGTGTHKIPTIQEFGGAEINIPGINIKFDLYRFNVDLITSTGDSPINLGLSVLDVLLIPTIFGLALVFFLLLKVTKYGKAMRAVASNKDLAASSGINVEHINLLANFIVGAFAGITGVFYIAKYSFDPADGLYLLLPAFAVIVLGTVGSLIGAFVASLLIGFSRAYSEPILSALQRPLDRNFLSTYKEVIPFVVLIIVLLFYTQGIGEALERRFNAISFSSYKKSDNLQAMEGDL